MKIIKTVYTQDSGISRNIHCFSRIFRNMPQLCIYSHLHSQSQSQSILNFYYTGIQDFCQAFFHNYAESLKFPGCDKNFFSIHFHGVVIFFPRIRTAPPLFLPNPHAHAILPIFLPPEESCLLFDPGSIPVAVQSAAGLVP